VCGRSVEINLQEAGKLSHEQWRKMAADLKKTAETRLFIGGEFVDAILVPHELTAIVST